MRNNNTAIAGRIYSSIRFLGPRKNRSTLYSLMHDFPIPASPKPGLYCMLKSFKTWSTSVKSAHRFPSFPPPRHLRASSSITEGNNQESASDSLHASDREVEPIDSWEEEDDSDPVVGDGGDGGGIIFQNCAWGERALSIAQEALVQFGEDLELYAFKTSPQGYIYVRLDKLSNEYGCPSMAEIESFSRQFKRKLDEVGASGDLPNDLALEVSSPGVDRLLKVPDDLLRFRNMPMVVNYLDDSDSRCPEKIGVYSLDLIETESSCCVWKLADVKENRDPSAKGRPLSRKQKDWRLKIPYAMIKRVSLYISY